MATFRSILGYFRPYWLTATLSIAASSLFEIIDLIVPYAIGQILNLLSHQPLDRAMQALVDGVGAIAGVAPDRYTALGVMLGLIFVASVLRAPIQPWVGAWFHWAISLKARRDRSVAAVAKILSLPLEFFDEHNPGRIAGRVARGLANHTWTYPEIAGQFIPKVVRVLGIFGAIWWVDRAIAAFFLVSFVAILGHTFTRLNTLIRKEATLDKHQENTESRTSEIVTNIKTVKAFATEAEELQRQRDRLERELTAVVYGIHYGYVKLGMEQRTAVQAGMFFVLGMTLAATVEGTVSLGHFVTTLTVASMAYAEIEPISTLAETFARRYASMLRFHEFLELPDGRDAGSLTVTAPAYRFTGKIHFEGVGFSYDGQRPVLADLDLLVEPYQTVALVGRSGSGKSTLVKLLFRYFDPSVGRILIDGQDIRDLDVRGYRKRLAIVHQEVDVFNGTLLENLTYGNRHVAIARVREACAIARVDEFVRHLPLGYNTIVGERGLRLSGGQRQRLGIARALIVDPDVLVFDEATSNLDSESERGIQQAMHQIRGTRTTIVIAHRLSTVREADKIVVLDGGRIVEVGSHTELLSRGGLYHRLHSLQASGDLH